MVTSNFWNTEFPDGECSRSADEVQYINRILSTVAVHDIPAGKQKQISDYIHFTLLHEAIESSLRNKLEDLINRLHELQAAR